MRKAPQLCYDPQIYVSTLHQDFGQSLKFLTWLYPQGPWHLCAISFDKKTFLGETFQAGPDDAKDVLTWLDLHDKFNLYYHVNRPIDSKKSAHASKVEIQEVHFLQIDCDLRPSEDATDGLARIRSTVERHDRRPSALVASGGGVNALWRLSRVLQAPIETPESHELFIDNVEARNKQLAADLEGDHVHDISRILRLPGSINRLNKQKVEGGRLPAETSIVWIDESTHEYTSFVAAPMAPKNQSSSRSSSRARGVTTDAVRTDSLSTLNVSEKLQIVLAQGRDPDDKRSGMGRSEWLHWACCEMSRARLSDSVMLGIITDSRYGISASILDKGSGMMRYALRQIDRGRAGAIDEDLVTMNDQFAVIQDYGGKCVVMIEDRLGDSVESRRFQAPRDFFAATDNRKKLIPNHQRPEKSKHVGVGSWWFDQAERRQYRRVVFEPAQEAIGDLNLWEGFAVQPLSGDLHQSYVQHIRDNICRGDEERFEYLIKWMARVVQRPNSQCIVAPILTGDRGTGKSLFASYFAKIFGKHAFTATSDREITGKFNSHLAQVVLLVGEEAFDVRDKRHASLLKSLITSETMSIEGKGSNLRQGPNYVHLVMLSNEEAVVPAGDHERRFFVIRVGDERRQDHEYFRQIVEDMSRGGLQHLLYYLLSVSLGDYAVERYPVTEELRQQQDLATSTDEDWLWDKLESGSWTGDSHLPWSGPIRKSHLYTNYQQYASTANVLRPLSERKFGQWLRRHLPNVEVRQEWLGQADRPVCFSFPPLDECRAFFAERRGRPDHEWRDLSEPAAPLVAQADLPNVPVGTPPGEDIF